MSVSQALFAFFSPEPRLAGLSGPAREGDVEGLSAGADSFASFLASQNPGELEKKLAMLLPEGLEADEALSLANDGKTLPDTLEVWMEEALAGPVGEGVVTAAGDQTEPVDLTEGAQRWLQWLDSARASLEQVAADHQAVADVAEAQPDAEQSATAAMPPGAGLGLLPPTQDVSRLAPVAPRDALAVAIDEAKGKAERKDAPLDAAGKDAMVNRSQGADQQTQTAPLQRAASVALAAESQLVSAQRMQDPEALLPRGGAADAESPGESRLAATQATPGQTPLTARPVNAAAQALGVPFGQPSWGEAMVEKVMWMSSQNLRSVEIRLDPAELGPLEIHIQNRGQDNQVQFLSQNPSVREALESQLFRLREMFSQQGMDRVDVTVADNSQRNASEGRSQGGFGEPRGQAGRGDATAGEAGQSILTTAAAARVSSDRLVDYYA